MMLLNPQSCKHCKGSGIKSTNAFANKPGLPPIESFMDATTAHSVVVDAPCRECREYDYNQTRMGFLFVPGHDELVYF